MTDAVMDWDRERRTGLPEAVYGAGKSVDQLAAILAEAEAQARRLLVTRLAPDSFELLPESHKKRLDYDPESQTAILGALPSPRPATVAVVTGGLSDVPVALEAVRTLAFSGVGAALHADIGVAGLWRLMDRLEDIRKARVTIVAAGMEGALFSVVAGLVDGPVIAVPTSCGRGVAKDGHVALQSALASCAPGLVCVNIDNGFGAAQAALRMFPA